MCQLSRAPRHSPNSLGQDILGASNTATCKTLRCLAAHDAYNHISYLPASRFWTVQGVESGIFLVLALALAIFTYSRGTGGVVAVDVGMPFRAGPGWGSTNPGPHLCRRR